MKFGITVCSNGQDRKWEMQNEELVRVLKGFGADVVVSPHIYLRDDDFSGTDEERAADLMAFYRDDSIDAIFDISGGDLANGVIKYLDFDVIADSGKTFWGYSDLTTIINSIYTMTGRTSVLWQIKNLVFSRAALQRKRFVDYLNDDPGGLFDIDYRFLQGSSMEGIVIGGNIRCLLKLAGTEFWPEMQGRVLLLESLSGASGQIAALLTQLEMMGVFEQAAGVLLGQFTTYERAEYSLSVYDLLKPHISADLPVAVTREIGHSADAKAIVIGKEMKF